MKEWNRPSCLCPPPEPPAPAGGFLMQRILGKGRLHKRQGCYSLCICSCQANEALQLADVSVCGQPRWEEMPCHERGSMLLQVHLPLCLKIRDAQGRLFTAESSLEESLKIRVSCRMEESWRGQIFVQSAVRLCGRSCPAENGCFQAPLEIILEGYILSPCAMGAPCPPPCPESRPWYPQPRFDPWNER